MNTGFTAKLLYNIISPFIHERSRRKFHFLGTNFNTNKAYLESIMNEDQLPSDFGGKNRSLDEILDKYEEEAHADHMMNLARLEPVESELIEF